NPEDLREQVLAAALIDQIDAPLRTLLQRGLVYQLPVPREAVAVLCGDLDRLDAQMNRAIALGLFAVSPNGALYVPRILPIEPPNEAEEELCRQAAQSLYRLWWEDAETSIEEQHLEMHRLALLGKEGAIASEIAYALAGRWRNASRYRDVVQLCKSTLVISEDYKYLKELAYSEMTLGNSEQADQYYERAITLCPDDDEQERALIYHFLGMLKDAQGQVEEAIALYQQSLELKERIGDVQGKAATLHNLAELYAQQGQVEEAIALYQQSLELTERIGNVQGKAATLHQLAGIYAQQGQVEEA
ncbi:MAG: tetratricopeptide repeat protein, partial [Elainellaceae cyanobacterium]